MADKMLLLFVVKMAAVDAAATHSTGAEPHVPGFNPENSHFDRGTPEGTRCASLYQVTAGNEFAALLAPATGALHGRHSAW